MPAIIGGLAGAGSLIGGLFGANAQSQAAQEEQQYLEQALGFQEGVYGTAKNNLSPFINTGTGALYSLASLYGLPGAPGQPNTGLGAKQAFANFTNLPSYQFPLEQGELAANRGLAASGLTGSGAQAKALTQYGQGYASQGFGNYISQLASLANLGETGASSLGQIGVGVGGQVGSTLGGIGAAGAAGTIGGANSLTNGIGGLLGALTANQSTNSNSALGGILSKIGNWFGGNSTSSGSSYQPQ